MTTENTQLHGQKQSVQRYDSGVQFIAMFHFLMAMLFLLVTIIMAFPTVILAFVTITESPPAFIGFLAVGMIAAITMMFTILSLVIGYGLWKYRQWARVSAMALAVVALFAFPLGTAIGALILWHLIKPEVAALFDAV